MAILLIENIECYAHHGCLATETVVGQRYSVDVKIEGDFDQAIASDDLNQAIDYCVIYELVKKEMAIPSKLIEHVAGRILTSVKNHFSMPLKISVRVIKYNPPVNGHIEKVSFELSN